MRCRATFLAFLKILDYQLIDKRLSLKNGIYTEGPLNYQKSYFTTIYFYFYICAHIDFGTNLINQQLAKIDA